jgi:hypothetical protein
MGKKEELRRLKRSVNVKCLKGTEVNEGGEVGR